MVEKIGENSCESRSTRKKGVEGAFVDARMPNRKYKAESAEHSWAVSSALLMQVVCTQQPQYEVGGTTEYCTSSDCSSSYCTSSYCSSSYCPFS